LELSSCSKITDEMDENEAIIDVDALLEEEKSNLYNSGLSQAIQIQGCLWVSVRCEIIRPIPNTL
ncbi:12698_t:CDS:2, partial [Gigaspora rosea]